MPEGSDGLNAAQLEAVTHPGGPLLVVGGAGTGKTATLVERFAWLVDQGAALEGGLDPFFACVTPADGLALLLDRIDELTLRRHEIRGNPAPLMASFVTRIDRLKDKMIEAREYVAYAQRLSH